jgi:hypothetical protein
MLSQNFKTPADLGHTEKEHAALVTVLGMLERGELKHVKLSEPREWSPSGKLFTGHFNMGEWNVMAGCGTVGCIGGTAEMLMKDIFNYPYSDELEELFYPPMEEDYTDITDITTDQAARALRSYLTTGKANWKEVLGE